MNDIYNFKFFHEKLSSNGMPTAEQMKSVAEAGLQLVINLAPHDVPNAVPNEAELAESLECNTSIFRSTGARPRGMV